MVKSLDTTVVDQVYAEMREGYTLLKGGEASAAEPYFLRLGPDPGTQVRLGH